MNLTNATKSTMGIAEEEPQTEGPTEQQVKDQKQIEKFQTAYRALVKETGLYLVIDLTSSLSDLKLGIAKLPTGEEDGKAV